MLGNQCEGCLCLLFGRQCRCGCQVVVIIILAIGLPSLIQGTISDLPSHSGNMKTAHLEDPSAKG